MQYKVAKLYTRGPETILKSFKNYADAVQFIQEQLAEDIRFSVQATYRIYEFDDLLNEFTQADAKPKTTSRESSSQTGKTQSFSPTPFNLSPTLGPRSWIKDGGKNDGGKSD